MSFSFFMEMAWKSALIAGGALLISLFLRSRSAADRAALLRLAIGLLLALPLISLLLPALQVELAAAAAEEIQPLVMAPAAIPESAQALSAIPSSAGTALAARPTIWDDPSALIALAYLGGMLMAALRLGAGLMTLRRWTRAAEPVDCPVWTAEFEKARNGRNVRLLASAEAPSPLSWGWRSPVVLIDRDTLDRPEDAPAILAHEMAHVVRRDWPALMLARAAAILFWFNPLVWLVERAFVQQAEEAADSHAVGGVEPVHYAQTLLGCASQSGRLLLPANSIASTGLTRRVKAILDGGMRGRKSGSMWTLAAMLGCVAFATPLAALQLTRAAPEPVSAPAAPATPTAPSVASVPMPPSVPAAAPAAPAAPVAPISPEDYPALAALQARAPAIAAAALASIDADEIGRIAEQAARSAGGSMSSQEIAEEIREAQEDAREAAEEARQDALEDADDARIDAQELAEEVRRETRAALREAGRSRAYGAAGMEAGARGMEEGARKMAEEARKLRTSQSYREQQIAKAAARGETVTHAELLEAARGMEEGAKGMVEGARGMRQGAAEMRRNH